MKTVTSFVLLLSLIVVSCTKEELITRPYPRVNTLTVKSIDASGAVLTGEIFYASVPTEDHGFIWSPYGNPLLGSSDKLSLGGKIGTGSFEGVAGWGLQEGKTYFMRAYAIGGGKEIYGDIEQFKAKGSPPPVITAISPELATWGDTVSLIGSNISIIDVSNPVTLNGAPADMIGGDSKMLKIRVPYTLNKEFSTIVISRTGGYNSTSPTLLKLKAPEIQSVTPSSGSAGTQVTITGLYLGSLMSRVYLNSVEAELTNFVNNSIVFKVPDGLPAGTVTLKIVTGDGGLFDTTNFTVN